MVGVKKFTAIAAVSAMVVTGAMANIQHQDASHHMLAHRGLAERNSQKQPTLIKVQKRLGPSIGDGLGGMINGLGRAIGLDGTYLYLSSVSLGLSYRPAVLLLAPAPLAAQWW